MKAVYRKNDNGELIKVYDEFEEQEKLLKKGEKIVVVEVETVTQEMIIPVVKK